MNLRKALMIFSVILIFTLLISGMVLVGQYNNSAGNDSGTKPIAPSTTPPRTDGISSVNILLVCEEGNSADDIYIINYMLGRNVVNLMTIPGNYRNTEGNKLSTVMGANGALGMIDNLKINFNINIRYYIKFDYTAFSKMVDILDGVNFSIPYAFKSETTNLEGGRSLYTGKMAVELFKFKDPYESRYTQEMLDSSYDGSLAKRRDLHTNFIYELLLQKGNASFISRMGKMIEECGRRIETNISEDDITELNKDAVNINIKKVNRYLLTGTDGNDLNEFFILSNRHVTEIDIEDPVNRQYDLQDTVNQFFKSGSIYYG